LVINKKNGGSMGTRASTIIKNGTIDAPIIINMYRQFDGYLSGHGKDLKDAFGNTKIINGISSQKAPEYANGMGCFAAQVVAKLKEGIGSIYLSPITSDTEGYTYILYEGGVPYSGTPNPVCIKVKRYTEEIYDGPLSEMPIDEE